MNYLISDIKRNTDFVIIRRMSNHPNGWGYKPKIKKNHFSFLVINKIIIELDITVSRLVFIYKHYVLLISTSRFISVLSSCKIHQLFLERISAVNTVTVPDIKMQSFFHFFMQYAVTLSS